MRHETAKTRNGENSIQPNKLILIIILVKYYYNFISLQCKVNFKQYGKQRFNSDSGGTGSSGDVSPVFGGEAADAEEIPRKGRDGE